MIFTPCTLLGVSAKINASNVVVMTSLGVPHAAEEALRSVCASAVVAMGELVIDGLSDVARVQVVLCGAFVHHDFCLTCDPFRDERKRGAL